MFGVIWAWLKRLFGASASRQVLRLGAGDGAAGRAADVVSEEVRRQGLLKPKHRRQVIRDERFMPKPERKKAWTKPAKLMSSGDAARLFADSLRTRNRELRTLATDEAQLKRYGLPLWKTEEDVARALGLTIGMLRHYATHREREAAPHYVTYSIPKRSGGVRLIHAPKKRLKAILGKLNAELVSKLPVSEHAHGFVRGRSVRTGAEKHVGKPVLLRLDLRDFFPTVTSARVRGLLVSLGYSYPVAATLAVLATESERQPVEIDGKLFHVPVGPRTCVQGAPTSPGLCNALVMKMDRRLAALGQKRGFAYTRYADDLTFSGPSKADAHRLRRAAERVIREEGFEPNPRKTRVMTQGGHQLVTGVTVNKVLGLSRKERRKLRAMLHQQGKQLPEVKRKAVMAGKLGWVASLNPAQAEALRKSSKKV